MLAALIWVPAASATVLDGPRASDHPTYKGWGIVDGIPVGGCRIGQLCGLPAWRWANSSWNPSYVCNRERVYIWPYGSGWSWVWSQRAGWLALQSRHLWIDPAGDGFGISMQCGMTHRAL